MCVHRSFSTPFPNPFLSQPTEILLAQIQYITGGDLNQLMRTCKSMKNLIEMNLDTICRGILINQFLLDPSFVSKAGISFEHMIEFASKSTIKELEKYPRLKRKYQLFFRDYYHHSDVQTHIHYPFLFDNAINKEDFSILNWFAIASPKNILGYYITELCNINVLTLRKKLDVIKWTFQYIDSVENVHDFLTVDAMNIAAENGYLDILTFLHFNSPAGCSRNAMDLAAKNGHLHILEFLHKNRTEGCSQDAMKWSASRGHTKVVMWLCDRYSWHCDNATLENVAYQGFFDILLFFKSRGYYFTDATLDSAIKGRHFQIVTWLYNTDPDIDCTMDGISYAIECGLYDILPFILRKNLNRKKQWICRDLGNLIWMDIVENCFSG